MTTRVQHASAWQPAASPLWQMWRLTHLCERAATQRRLASLASSPTLDHQPLHPLRLLRAPSPLQPVAHPLQKIIILSYWKSRPSSGRTDHTTFGSCEHLHRQHQYRCSIKHNLGVIWHGRTRQPDASAEASTDSCAPVPSGTRTTGLRHRRRRLRQPLLCAEPPLLTALHQPPLHWRPQMACRPPLL